MEKGELPKALGANLSEALSLFVQLRLKQQIDRVQASESGVDDTPNAIDLQKLNKLERELLRDALSIVKDFKKFLTNRYHIGT